MRLVRAGILSDEQREQFLGTFVDAPAPFFEFAETSKQAEQIETGILIVFTCIRCQPMSRWDCQQYSTLRMTSSVARPSTPREASLIAR